MLYLGIDQHGKQLTVDLRDEQGDVAARGQSELALGRGVRCRAFV